MRSPRRLLVFGCTVSAFLYLSQVGPRVVAQAGQASPVAVLEAAPEIRFPSDTDSNSPAFWQLVRGVPRLVVINSALSSTSPMLNAGPNVQALDAVGQTSFKKDVEGGRWIEAVVPDVGGRLIGFYHFEPWNLCENGKTAPRIGMARSNDAGRSWTDLGIVLRAAPGRIDCDTTNHFFAGGVGDFSVALDPDQQFLYFLFSVYGPNRARQGVAIARMLWSHRLAPKGQVAIWSDGVWRYPEPTDDSLVYPAATPIFPTRLSWHNRNGKVDAFWGPSVHWNTFLKRYVMLLNHAKDSLWAQEGVYVSATKTIEDPSSWTPPQLLLPGGVWYPQVIGLEPGVGTDRLAGERARFFMGGVSRYQIRFLAEGAGPR